MVRGHLAEEFHGLENVTLIALAGEQYRTALHGAPWPCEVPMKGSASGSSLPG